MQTANFTVRLPFFDSINVGTLLAPTGSSLQRDLRTKTQYVFYSSPVSDPVEIWAIGWTPNSNLDKVKVQITNTNDSDIWMPLISTPINAIAGVLTQAEPLLPLAEPYVLAPFGRLQLFFQKIGADSISNTVITLAGVRLVSRETFPCFN